MKYINLKNPSSSLPTPISFMGLVLNPGFLQVRLLLISLRSKIKTTLIVSSNDSKRPHDVAKNKLLEEWQLEAASVDRAIQILPGVKRLIDSIPAGRYAVATSATKFYGTFACLIVL